MDHLNVVNEKELDWGESSHGEEFDYRRKPLSWAMDSEKLGCSL